MRLRLLLSLFLLGSAGIPLTSFGRPLACPHAIGPGKTATAQFERVGAFPDKERKLAGSTIYNGSPGEESGRAPASLAPDEDSEFGGSTIQRWRLESYREGGLLLVCRYSGTGTYLRALLPATLSVCKMTTVKNGALLQVECN